MVTETVASLQWSRILGLAAGAGLTFYDASYVWLARAGAEAADAGHADLARVF